MIKIKIGLTYVYKEYEVKIKNGTGAMSAAKNKVLAGEEAGGETPPITTCWENPANMCGV